MNWKSAALMLALAVAGGIAPAQQDATKAAAALTHDAEADEAAQMVGRALFLRCFCAEDNLSFDAQGHVAGQAKTTDWTLAAVNVQKVERKGPGEIELDGVKVAIRFATDRREFDRHPQNDDKMRIVIADTGDAAAFERALKSVFATGIDRELQRAMPQYWQHYFEPGLAWPQDALTGQAINSIAAATPTASIAAVTHKSDAGYTPLAGRDRVGGTVRLRMVVDAEGMPRRIAVLQPLGYGLDERAVEALGKYRFTPAMVQGQPVASNVTIDEEFVVVQTPR